MLLIYGANGYTGRLICEEASKAGQIPVLAGRNAGSIRPLAESYGWNWRCFDLNGPGLDEGLKDITVVLHCAGPFRFTMRPMLDACLRHGIHYLDITGEIDCFAMAADAGEAARGKGVLLLPGVGFDVVPTDCLAALLHRRLPDANQLELAFVTRGGQVSHGTAMSMSEKLGEGGMVRANGQLVREPIGRRTRWIEVDGRRYRVASIPWGDVFTAWHTTQIPNMVAYTGLPEKLIRLLKWQGLFGWVLRSGWFKRWLQARIRKRPAGPTPEQRAKARSYVWGRAANAEGHSVTAWLSCPDGYTLTALSAVHIAREVLEGKGRPGYHTPAGLFGPGLLQQIPGVSEVHWREEA